MKWLKGQAEEQKYHRIVRKFKGSYSLSHSYPAPLSVKFLHRGKHR